ncbi:complex I intermediate-associated protein 30, mitochondrial [Hyperolius riggenbachi]|uniref:complex I intermediate-associated protein 30, mitochondrial n=1 Tax=Hyperolius riggenbachi TaxID=752182 RepID=UPI0035A37A3E
MAFINKLAHKLNFRFAYQQTKAFRPVLYPFQHHCIPNVRSYKMPSSSLDNTALQEKPKVSFKEKVVNSWKNNAKLLLKEIGDHLFGKDGKPVEVKLLEQTTVLWEFREPEDLQNWLVTSDVEIGGKSEAFLKLGPNNQTAFFYGVLNTEVPRDGEKVSSGYCALKSRSPKGAFGRQLSSDWSDFNTLHLRIRGDGRPWMLNIQSDTYFTHHQYDLYHYFLFTRGGPYWQDVKIPFSKFFMANKGKIQDQQYEIIPDKVVSLGFTLADMVDGPFQLEIDFIALCKDLAHKEKCAYELYKNTPM